MSVLMPKSKDKVKPSDVKSEYLSLKHKITELGKLHKALVRNIDNFSKDVVVRVNEKKESKLLLKHLEMVYNNMKSSDALIVSLSEFKNVKDSLNNIKTNLIAVEKAIKTSMDGLTLATRYLKSSEEEIAKCKATLKAYGKVYSFSRTKTKNTKR